MFSRQIFLTTISNVLILVTSFNVVAHSQFVREDQLKTFQKYKLMPSFFTNHAFFWGDVHVENLGTRRAHFLSPMNRSAELNLTYTSHTDIIVTPIDQMFSVYTAVNRLSRSGKIIGKGQRVSPYTALKAITINAAIQAFDEHIKGTLEVGKMADLVILDNNTLTVKPIDIKDIQAVSTIKAGLMIYNK